mmetsp:Transcript_34638/g.74909  ORF Transcript_34638/g.74909 Transcript_34638/m.74909 type:complete len:110 (+) Transcript_34638:833-1162(+)
MFSVIGIVICGDGGGGGGGGQLVVLVGSVRMLLLQLEFINPMVDDIVMPIERPAKNTNIYRVEFMTGTHGVGFRGVPSLGQRPISGTILFEQLITQLWEWKLGGNEIVW